MTKQKVRTRVLSAVAALSLLGAAGAAQADTLEDILQTGVETQKLAQASQQRIDKIVEETNDLAQKYKTVLKEIDGLKVYNQQLDKQISNQQKEMVELGGSIERVTEVERQITPLMMRMVDSLERFIELDIPFQIETRRAGVQRLRELMDRSDVATSEKFRNVLDAYQIESAYGRSFEAYEGVIELDGQQQNVDFLQVGRIALLYLSRDGSVAGAWNQTTRNWERLPDRYASSITQGLRVARKQAAADQLLMLPVPAPENAQ